MNYSAFPLSRTMIIFGTVSCMLLGIGALSSGQEIGLPNNPLAGQRIFLKKGCIKCHSIFGQGGKIGRDFGKTLVHRGPAGIFAMMWNHSSEMSKLMQKVQRLPIFSEREMADFVAFIYFLGYLGEEGEPEKGREVLEDKRCLTCHRVGGKGGERGPPLDEMRSSANPLALAERMWRYGLRMSAEMSALGVPRPEFSDTELIDLFAYLREISDYITSDFSYLTPGKPVVGEELFEEKNCLQCHRIGDKGEAVGPDLTQSQLHVGVTQIAALMWKHGPQMWKEMRKLHIGRPIFDNNELADLVAYLYFLRFTEQRGDLNVGKQLFTKKGCVQCHAIRGIGGNVAKDLALSSRAENYIKITTAMWNHNRTMRMLMEKMGIPMPRFSEQEMTDLFFYLSSSRKKYEP